MFDLVVRAASIVMRARGLVDLVGGGYLTGMLDEVGTVLSTSGAEHLYEAATSPDPRRRLQDAAGDFQTAYVAFDRAAARGVNRDVRRFAARFTRTEMEGVPGFGTRGLLMPVAKAADAAAIVAVLRHYLDEPAEVQRKWLDRVGKHASTYWRDVAGGVDVERVHYPSPAPVEAVLEAYFTLELNLLPPTLIRSRPSAWRAGTTSRVYLKKDFSVRDYRPGRVPPMSPRYVTSLPRQTVLPCLGPSD